MSTTARPIVRAIASFALALGLVACGGGEGEADKQGTDKGTPPGPMTYDVRGYVQPDMQGMFAIEHEAIDTFVDSSGAVVGMGAMSMSFPLAEGVDISGFRGGDAVRFTFDVRYEPITDFVLTSIEPLGTVDPPMRMRPAAPPGSPFRAELDARGEPSETYAVRGIIRTMPTPERPLEGFSLTHEAIPDFVNAEGEMVGMSAMTMPFPRAEGLDLADLSVGDKVEAWFAVWRNGGAMEYRTFKLIKLSPRMPLELPSE